MIMIRKYFANSRKKNFERVIWVFFPLTYVWYKLKAIAVLALSPMVVPKAVAAGCSCRVAGMQEAALIV